MSLSPEIIRLAKYPPETVIEARPLDLATGAWTPLVELRYIPDLVVLREFGQERNTNVRVKVSGVQAGKRLQWDQETNAAPGIDWHYLRLAGGYDEEFMLEYYSRATIADYRARCTFTVKPYSVAEKLAYGVSLMALTDEERALADEYGIANKIKFQQLPMSYPLGALLYTGYGAFEGDIGAGVANETPLFEVVPPAGCKVVLRRIWASRPAANYDDLTLKVYHDKVFWFDIYPHCLIDHPTASRPIELLWIVGLKELRLTLYSGVGHTGLHMFCNYEVRRLTIWDKIAWDLLKDKRITTDEERALVEDLKLTDKFKAGIYEAETMIIR